MALEENAGRKDKAIGHLLEERVALLAAEHSDD